MTERLENEQSSHTHTAELILQPFHHFTYVTTHSPILPSLYLRHNSFSNPSVSSSTSQFILQSFFRFSYVTSSSLNHSSTFPSLHLRYSSFSTLPSLYLRNSSFANLSFASPTSQALHLIHLASRAHSPTFPSLHQRHNSFSNPSVALPTSQFILQPFFRFSYVTSSSLNSPGEPPMLLMPFVVRKNNIRYSRKRRLREANC